MENLERAFSYRDHCLYEALLDSAFRFTEPDCDGNPLYDWGLEKEMDIIGRSPGDPGLFERYHIIIADLDGGWSVEPGGKDPEHPNEDWDVFTGWGRIELYERYMTPVDSTYHLARTEVTQKMTLKLRRVADKMWRVVRWMDDSLSTDCNGWGKIKAGVE